MLTLEELGKGGLSHNMPLAMLEWRWPFSHLRCLFFRVADHEMENKMSALNIASIFGPILMVVDKVR